MAARAQLPPEGAAVGAEVSTVLVEVEFEVMVVVPLVVVADLAGEDQHQSRKE